MSKKKKFKKFSKNQMLEEIKKSETTFPEKSPVNTNQNNNISAKTPEQKSISPNSEYNYVKSDLKKIIVVFSVIILILIGIIIINQRTVWLSNFSDMLVKTLNINQ